MSALDPSAPGLPLAGGGGGGASIPVSDFADVLAGATPSQIAATDASGNGTLSSFSSVLYASRRLAADADTRLLWECDGGSGVLANTGSLGSAGDLTAGGSCVRNVLSPRSTIGRGIRGNGVAAGGATGATNVTLTGTALTATATFVVPSWPGGSVPVLARNAGAGWGPYYLGFRISLNAGGVVQAELQLAGSAPAPYAGGYGAGMHQAVAVYNGAHFLLYVDGELAAQRTATADMAMDAGGAGGTWNLAAQGDGGGFNGHVLRAQVLATSWTADRVAQEWVRTLGNCP